MASRRNRSTAAAGVSEETAAEGGVASNENDDDLENSAEGGLTFARIRNRDQFIVYHDDRMIGRLDKARTDNPRKSEWYVYQPMDAADPLAGPFASPKAAAAYVQGYTDGKAAASEAPAAD